MERAFWSKAINALFSRKEVTPATQRVKFVRTSSSVTCTRNASTTEWSERSYIMSILYLTDGMPEGPQPPKP
jgi:hypothetical protein